MSGKFRFAITLFATMSAACIARAGAKAQSSCGGARVWQPRFATRGVNGPSNASGGAGIGYFCEDGSQIDLLVVYTAQARQAAGGTTQIQALISGAVADTNAAFGRSGISTSIILVHTAEVSYAETGDADIDGPRLVDPNDGYLDDVHALRDEYGADCVSLWVDQLNSGGIGYFPHPSLTGVGASGFSMLRLSNATTLTLAHELGHNLFCAHDRSDAPDAPWADYSYGYVETGGNWQTIMAVTGATYIPYFANPNVSWPGPVPPPPGPTGVAEGSPNPSDIARTINETSYYVANFRPRRILGLPSVLHVDSTAMPGGDGASWATAMSDLGDAVCAAAGSNGAVTQIWVRAGTYTPDRESGDRALSFHLVDGVEILGGFAGGETAADQRDPQLNTTILSGEIGAAGLTDNSYHVVDGAARAASAVLDGFTIRDGYADADPNDGGAGVRVFGVGAPTIRDCRIVDNAGNRGGGVYCAFGASPRFENCRIQLNSALLTTWPAGGGGAHCYVNAHPTFSACEFSANTAELGAGVAMLFGCAPEFADCEFLQNDGGVDGSGGGLYAYGDCDATLTRCVFQNNNAHYGMGIALFFDCDPTVTDCDFVDHNRPTDAEGGGMYVYSTCSPVIEGCLFADNHTLSGGGIVCLFGGAPRLAGCVFRGNVADGDSGAASFYSETQPLVVSCLFSGNSAPFGGAISTWFDTTARITNCSLVSNVATNSGAGIYGYEADPLIENSILWGNHVGVAVDEAAQVSGFNTTPIVNASTVQGWSGALGGVANSGADPVLRDADGVDNIAGTPDDDARLSVGSPAIDTGDDALVPVGAVVDLLGRPRTLGAHVDRGAFEFGVSVGDLDQDGRFGAAELGALAVCMGGPDRSPVAAPPYSLAECLAAFDLDSDGDIDARDVAGLQRLP